MAGDTEIFEAAMKKAHSLAWEERWLEAIEEYELATAEFPEDEEARSGLASAYHREGRLREALREYRKLCELQPEDPAPRTKVAEVLEALGRSADAGEAWLTLAELCMRRQDVQQATEAWREVIRLQPEGKEARCKLADAYAESSRSAEAVKEYLALARLCQESGEPEQAARYCQSALALDSGNRAARALLGRVASQVDRDVAVPALAAAAEELGPVREAIERALASLAEAILEDERLVAGDEVSVASGEARSSELRTLLGKAIDLHSRGEIDEALGYYETVLDRGAALVEVPFALGLLSKHLSRFDDAVRYLQKSAPTPEYALASRLALGQCHWAQGRVNEALESFLEALKLIDLELVENDQADEVRRAYEALEAGGWGRGNGRGSEVLVASFLDLLGGSDWKETVNESRLKLMAVVEDGAPAILPDVLDIPGGNQVVDLMALSRQHLKAGMPFTALEECYQAIRLAPVYLPLHLRLAEIFAEQGKAEEAVSKYSEVAEAYLARDNTPKAIEVYRRALSAAPMAISVREKLIQLLIAQGDMELAMEEYVALGDSYYRLARVDAALKTFERGLVLAKQAEGPQNWQTRILRRVADLQTQRVHWKEAARTYEQILALSPEDEQARLRLVELHYKLGQEKLALGDVDALIVQSGQRQDFQGLIRVLKDLVESNPQDISIRSRLSRIYLDLGMTAEAVAELDTLGELQLEAGRRKEAMETLRAIIALEPHEKDGYTRLLRELEKGAGKS
jgi:tetratricopeptide (TPR) repeat protein